MREMVTSDQKTFLKNITRLDDTDFIQRKIGILFNDLLENICQDLDIATMTLQDKLYLLLFLRSRLRGDNTELSVKCEKCDHPIKFQYSLDRFVKKVKDVADSVETPKTMSFNDSTIVIDAIMIKEEIESDTLLSDKEWVEAEEIGISELSNLMRVTASIKEITVPKGTVVMSDYHMKERYEMLMRMPMDMMTKIVEEISQLIKSMFDIMSDKIEIPCLRDTCDGKTKTEIQIGDEGFFIKSSSE